MASEIRVNRLSNRSGLSTITFANGGVQFSGITTFANGDFRVGTGATIMNPSSNEMQFHTGGSNRLTINNSGANLGTGNITAVDATFSGNVSIGKTLTYEDVKNVDSVGVVTARTGVKITGGDFTVGTAITASSVTGNVTQDVGITTFSGSATWFKGLTANKDMYWSKSSGSLIFKDTARILVGDGSDLQIHHTSGNSFIENSTGTLKIRGATIELSNPSAAQMLQANSTAAVNLYFNGNKKFETHAQGIKISSNAIATAYIYGATGQDAEIKLICNNGAGNADYFQFRNQHSDKALYLENYSSGSYQSILKGTTSRSIELHYQGSKKLETSSSGVDITGDVTMTNTSSNPQLALISANNGISEIQFGDGADAVRGNIVYRAGSAGDALCFNGYNNTERMRIHSDGKFSFGTTSGGFGQWAFVNAGSSGGDATGGETGLTIRSDEGFTNTDVTGSDNWTLKLRNNAYGGSGVSGNQGTVAKILFSTATSNGWNAFVNIGCDTQGTGGSKGDFFVVPGGGSEALRINASGKLLIGSTRTYYANDYYDDITINNSGGSGATGGCGITMISDNDSWGAVQFGDQDDDDCAYIKYDHGENKFIFGVEDGSVRFWLNKNKTWLGTTGHGDGSRSTLLDIVGANQDPTGVWTQMGLYSSDSQAANKGGSIGFGGQDGSTARQQFAAIKGAKENGTSGNYAGYMAFYTRPAGAVSTEKMRILSDGRTGINIDDARFGQGNSASSNKFYQNIPKLGVQGSIVIGNLSSTATDVRELAFYRRAGSTAGSAISTHHMGRIAWYGSSNDTSFPDRAWSLECNPNGNGWTAGSNRHGYLSFISGQNGEYVRLTSSGYLSVGFAGAPDTRLHIKGNSDNGGGDATLTIEDTDNTSGSKEPTLAFDGNGTRQGRIMSNDTTGTTNSHAESGGLYFGVGSSNTTALQITNNRGVVVYKDARDWATVRHNNSQGLRTHVRQYYSPGNAVQTQTIMRIRRHWWGWGTYKIRCKALYYNSSLESTYFVNGHGSGGNNYSIAKETFGGDASNQDWSCTVTHTASNNSPGNSTTWYADIKVNIPNYYYVIVYVEAYSSQYSMDPSNMGSDSYCMM